MKEHHSHDSMAGFVRDGLQPFFIAMEKAQPSHNKIRGKTIDQPLVHSQMAEHINKGRQELHRCQQDQYGQDNIR